MAYDQTQPAYSHFIFILYIFIFMDLKDLHSSPNTGVIEPKRMRWTGHVTRTGERKCVHKVLMGRTEGKRLLGIPRRRWEDNIKMDLHNVEWGSGTCLIWPRIGTGGRLLLMR